MINILINIFLCYIIFLMYYIFKKESYISVGYHNILFVVGDELVKIMYLSPYFFINGAIQII